MIIEKAYAKLHGSYNNIDGGLVDIAMAELTNGIPDRLNLTDEDVKANKISGAFWNDLKTWVEKDYLLGVGSP